MRSPCDRAPLPRFLEVVAHNELVVVAELGDPIRSAELGEAALAVRERVHEQDGHQVDCGLRLVGPRLVYSRTLQEIHGGTFAQRQHARCSRTPRPVLGNERARTQEPLDTERWINEGSLGAEAIALPQIAAASEAPYRDALAAGAKPTT